MASLTQRAAWLALAGLIACTQIVDFDRSRIDLDETGMSSADGGGSRTDGGGHTDSGSPISPDAQIGVGDARLPGSCTSDGDCGPSELCCAGQCTQTVASSGCATCDGQSCGVSGEMCAGRACSCGGGPACSGSAPNCAPMTGTNPPQYRCVQCVGNADCATGTICVDNECRACDSSKGNDGCKNPAPICAAGNTCVTCDANHPCPSPLTCAGGSCFGCDGTTNAGCAPSSTAPVCDPGQGGALQCEGCAADAECVGNPTGAQCASSGACVACDPAESAQATNRNPACPDPARSFCDAASGTCRGCAADSDCRKGQKCATASSMAAALVGRCVECTSSRDCTAEMPICNLNAGTCGGCTGDAECAGSTVGKFCSASGRCGVCKNDAQCLTMLSVPATCTSAGTCVPAPVVDAGMPDAGMADSGMPDAGMVDSGMPDAGTMDSGMPDAGMMDSGMPDASVSDAGPDSGSSVAIAL